MGGRSRTTARAADTSAMSRGPARRRGGYSHPRDTCVLFHIPRGLAALLEVIEEGIPHGVGLGLPEPLPGDATRLCRRPGLLGDVDLDDLTAAYQLRNRLTRQANGFIARGGFEPARWQGRNGYLDTALRLLGENERVLHRPFSLTCRSGVLHHGCAAPSRHLGFQPIFVV